MAERGEWVRLGEDPPHEVAFGAIGRFWAGETAWETINAEGFETFQLPGYARIGCNFSLRPYGAAQTLVSYECRTQATDDVARRGFLRYWRPLSPLIGVVLRSQLHVVADEAARSGPSSDGADQGADAGGDRHRDRAPGDDAQ
jgi:hypothetical protein